MHDIKFIRNRFEELEKARKRSEKLEEVLKNTKISEKLSSVQGINKVSESILNKDAQVKEAFRVNKELKAVLKNINNLEKAFSVKGLDNSLRELLEKDARVKEMLKEQNSLLARRNSFAKEVAELKKQNKPIDDILKKSKKLSEFIKEKEKVYQEKNKEIAEKSKEIRNLIADDVPEGIDEADNVELRTHGTVPAFDFTPKQHFELLPAQMDFDMAATISGARFVLLRGGLAKLERALAQFMLDTHSSKFGYEEVVPPLLVRDAAMQGTGQLPKFAEDSYKTSEGHWLIPTSEVPLTNMVAGQILAEKILPLRFCAYTPCFRSEAGSAGKDTRGLIRQHQFSKVELVSITAPEHGEAEQEHKLEAAEHILRELGLPYRIMLLCAGDTGFSARRTYDIEVWLPGQDCYREISSVSWCGDFQARRMKARMRREGQKQTEFVHTLNGSGLAVGRTMVALLENYQQADGTIALPDVLHSYMGGMTVLRP